MKLSIITINYNNAEGLRKTLVSVASQTYRDIEHIIIDGASTDGSVDVIREYENTIKQQRCVTIDKSTIQVKWLSEPDNGIYDAMSKGVKKASGDYIWILNSGDCVAAADTVGCMMEVISHHTPSIPLLLGNIVKFYPDGRKVNEKRSNTNSTVPIPLDTSMLTFYRGTVPQDAAFVRRDLFEKYGLFDPELKIVSDWKLYLNMIALGDIIPMYVNIDVVHFDMSGVSNTNASKRYAEKRAYLEEILPASVLKDYDVYSFPIEQYKRLRKHHLWGLVWFIERVLFKLEKWHFMK